MRSSGCHARKRLRPSAGRAGASRAYRGGRSAGPRPGRRPRRRAEHARRAPRPCARSASWPAIVAHTIMQLDGIHHITAITADAQRNVDFYVGVLGLRLVKKSVNQDDPTVYHLFYGDEHAHPGLDLTFFEYPGAAPGRAGDGMIHRLLWRVGSEGALDFWAERLAGAGIETRREGGALRFADPEGLDHELLVVEVSDEPLTAEHPEVPAEHALQGFHAVRAYSTQPERSVSFLDTLGFEAREGEGSWESRGERRGSFYAYDAPPSERGVQGAGTVHHVAWTSDDEDHEAWRGRVQEAGGR